MFANFIKTFISPLIMANGIRTGDPGGFNKG